MLVILTHSMLKHEHLKFKSSLAYTRPSLKNKRNTDNKKC